MDIFANLFVIAVICPIIIFLFYNYYLIKIINLSPITIWQALIIALFVRVIGLLLGLVGYESNKH